MEKEQRYNLSGLLRLKELDIRKVVADNPSLTVGEYFNAITKLENDINIMSVFQKFITLKADEKDIKCLEEKKSLFEAIGSFHYVDTINEAVSAIKRGRRQLAADYIRSLVDNYNAFLELLITAKKQEDTETKHCTQ